MNQIISAEPQGKDWIKGTNSQIVWQNLLTTADWIPWQSATQRQSDTIFDSDGCVSYSAVNGVIAPRLNLMLYSKLIPQATVDWATSIGMIVNGKFELSDRAVAVGSNTDPHKGNTAQAVWEYIRTKGICSAKTWPNLLDVPNATVTQFEYYAPLAAQAIQESADFLKHFSIAWQFITTGLEVQDLHMAPIQEFTAVNIADWYSGGIVPAFAGPSTHATAVHYIEPAGVKDILDQYMPFQKKLAANYPQNTLVQGVVYPTPQGAPVQPIVACPIGRGAHETLLQEIQDLVKKYL